MRFRAAPAIAAVLLTAACSSTTATSAPAPSPTAPAATTAPATPGAAPPSTAAASPSAPAQKPELHVVIPASKLPYPAAAGAPALGDVSVLKTAADPCTIPADDSGNEGQLINAALVGPVVAVTFEFTNPCTKPLTYAFKVIQAMGSATGPSGGDPVETATQTIAPGQSVTMKVNVDPKAALTAAQLQQLWVGISHISKQPGY